MVSNEREKRLIREVEQAQTQLRETIEESKRLTEQSDALIAKVKGGLGPIGNDNEGAGEAGSANA